MRITTHMLTAAITAGAIMLTASALNSFGILASKELPLPVETEHEETPSAVLMYHCISEPPKGALVDMYVSPKQFENQLIWLKERGYESGFAYDCRRENTVVLTFDDGYADFYHNAYPLLLKHGMKATVFVITGYIGHDGYLDEKMIKEMSESGLVDVQSHTVNHVRLDTVDGEALYDELEASKSAIESITGKEVHSICYPNGAYDNDSTMSAEALYRYGFTTIFPADHSGIHENYVIPRYGIPYDVSKEEFFGIFIPVTVDAAANETADTAEDITEDKSGDADDDTALLCNLIL